MKIRERIEGLRAEMDRKKIDIYIIPSTDAHSSEYVGEYFKVRQYMTGFTGSAGTAVFTKDKAALWTDGRYFIQAEQELEGTGIMLCKAGEPDCDTIEQFLRKELPAGGTIGFDGRTMGVSEGKMYEKIAVEKAGTVHFQTDLAGRIWKDRPALPAEKAFLLAERYTGESTASKLERVRAFMDEKGADIHLLSSLDDIAWLLNVRGNDVAYCPLILSYLLLYKDHAEIYADGRKFSEEIQKEFDKNNIFIHDYEQIYKAVENLPKDSRILLDPGRVNYSLYQKIPGEVRMIEQENPEILMKCVKNHIEVKNIKNAHLKDAVAAIRFMRWLKKKAESGEIRALSERSVSQKLEDFRRAQEGYLEASFEPISAFAEHGAIVHYSASGESDAPLDTGSLLLMDTGGHYLEGSTDITRTFALGEVPKKQKEDFTLVARAMLRLMNTRFLYGCSGANLDCIAREVFWKEKVNFNHGTGHGVGYLTNVHEAPISFRWKEGSQPAPVLERNMVITDEPGIYLEGSHGIRLENELLVCADEKNEYGQFMRFEPLTFVPIDLDAIVPEKMSAEEKKMLNDYHSEVYRKTESFLDAEEKEWLKRYTRPV